MLSENSGPFMILRKTVIKMSTISVWLVSRSPYFRESPSQTKLVSSDVGMQEVVGYTELQDGRADSAKLDGDRKNNSRFPGLQMETFGTLVHTMLPNTSMPIKGEGEPYFPNYTL